MTFQITVLPSGHQFVCDEDETILSAALKAGIGLPYGCKNGACGSCKGKIIEGKLVHGDHQQKALSDEEEAQGSALFCCAKPVSNVTVETREIINNEEYPIKKIPSRILQLKKLSHDVMQITLQLPATEVMTYRAGQYIEFLLKDGKRRSYSMANAPHQNQPITLHIRHTPGGLFTEQVFNTLKERDILRFEGPHGSFFLRDDSSKPIILLAAGTGFAPIKALVEHLIYNESTRFIHLYWGGRRPADIYMHQLCESWAHSLPHLTYIPVVSDAQQEDQWQGRTGFVHQAVIDDFPDLSGHQVYVCGAPIVVESAKKQFTAQCKLPVDEFYSDAFTTEADSPQ